MLPKRTRFTLSDGRRGPVAVAITVWILVAVLLASSCAGSREASAAAAPPSVTPELQRLTLDVRRLRLELVRAQAELRRLSRLTRALTCTIRVYEDASATFRDPEQASPACRVFIGRYVGDGQFVEDAR